MAPQWQRSSCSKPLTARCGSGTYITNHVAYWQIHKPEWAQSSSPHKRGKCLCRRCHGRLAIICGRVEGALAAGAT
jgi:hypothetical protein